MTDTPETDANTYTKFDPRVAVRPVLSGTKDWFDRCFPKPSVQNFTTQLGVHFEEISETIAEITPNDQATLALLMDAKEANTRLADHLKAHSGCVMILPENYIKYLDALCDTIVTSVGNAHMADFDIVGALMETNRENFSKFDDDGNPIYHPETGKVTKGPHYTVSDLTPYI